MKNKFINEHKIAKILEKMRRCKQFAFDLQLKKSS